MAGSLQELYLWDNCIGDIGAAVFGRYVLTNNILLVDRSGLATTTSNSVLIELNFQCNQIGELARNHTLQSLNLASDFAGDKGAAAWTGALVENAAYLFRGFALGLYSTTTTTPTTLFDLPIYI